MQDVTTSSHPPEGGPSVPPGGNWHGPPPWHGPPGRRDDAREWAKHWRNRGDGQPLRRDPDDRLAGGVAAGLGAWRGFSPTTVRIVLAVAALISQGWAVPFYVLGWLLLPVRGQQASIASRAKHDSRGVALALALASVLGVFLFLAGAFNNSAIETYGWPQVISVAGLTLIWRNAPDDERAGMRRLVEPLGGHGSAKSVRRANRLRFAGAAVLLAVGFGWLFSLRGGTQLLQPLGGFLLVAAALVLLFGPWWLRIARDLVVERQARARAEERADIAAHMHDSVLQTLALIQRRAEDPQAVVQLARAQERDLRSWLFEGRAPGDADVSSFAEGIRQIQRDVEARHGVPVEVVTVADCPLDEHLSALLAAAREATVNAAKWSGAAVISVYAEAEPDKVNVAVRDRGKGFDPAAVPGDRKGVAESIHGRMTRHGGEATVQSAPGEGTKVTLTMPRSARPEPEGQASTAAGGPRR
jgi:phage shock protein PspC (stress-responsive transcriptional regulator)/anti-sigma regulatory factor (Ser/Thr protein kinase)